MKGLDTRLTNCESTDVAYNTRLETLEAGEFETVTANGLYGDIYGMRMGVITFTQPTPWSPVTKYTAGPLEIKFYGGTTYTGEYNFNISTANFVHWDDIDGDVEGLYTITRNHSGISYRITQIDVTFVDYFTGETTTKSETYSTNSGTTTMTGPAIASKITIVVTTNGTNYAAVGGNNVSISSSFYVKPKGT